MDNLLLSALTAIDVHELSYTEWMTVGMALKQEGFPCDVWDEWSRNDRRYHPGECARKWNTFHGSGTPITASSSNPTPLTTNSPTFDVRQLSTPLRTFA